MATTATAAERASESGKKLEFKGVFPANPTPVHADGRINEEALRAIFEENLAHGVNGFWVAGSTGEGPIMNDQQRTTRPESPAKPSPVKACPSCTSARLAPTAQ